MGRASVRSASRSGGGPRVDSWASLAIAMLPRPPPTICSVDGARDFLGRCDQAFLSTDPEKCPVPTLLDPTVGIVLGHPIAEPSARYDNERAFLCHVVFCAVDASVAGPTWEPEEVSSLEEALRRGQAAVRGRLGAPPIDSEMYPIPRTSGSKHGSLAASVVGGRCLHATHQDLSPTNVSKLI